MLQGSPISIGFVHLHFSSVSTHTVLPDLLACVLLHLLCSSYWVSAGTVHGLTVCVVVQDFSFENSTASVRAYASYTDGFANDVTDLAGLNISSLTTALTVNDTVGNITVSMLQL